MPRKRREAEEEKRWRRRERRRKTERSVSDTETIWCLRATAIPGRLPHLTQHTRVLLHKSRRTFQCTHTNTRCGLSSRSVRARVRACVFMHLVAVPNKADRLTGHIASNQKSGRESDRGRQRERGRKDLALNGVLRH